ncbi:MAG TPA: hypothetical protein PKY87_08845 [Terricaulis sp.]|nr:hypothetical protein [Terricaulis sp.]
MRINAAAGDHRVLTLPAEAAITGPWLAIPSGAPARVGFLALVGDPALQGRWRSIDAEQPIQTGPTAPAAKLTPLSDFGIACQLYPHTRVLSVRVVASPAWKHQRAWDGALVERVRVPAPLWPLVAAAARDCNLQTYQRGGR